MSSIAKRKQPSRVSLACPSCKKTFSSSLYLHQHRELTNNRRCQYSTCPGCNAEFDTPQLLDDHRSSHLLTGSQCAFPLSASHPSNETVRWSAIASLPEPAKQFVAYASTKKQKTLDSTELHYDNLSDNGEVDWNQTDEHESQMSPQSGFSSTNTQSDSDESGLAPCLLGNPVMDGTNIDTEEGRGVLPSHISHTNTDVANVALLQLLSKWDCPIYAYEAILHWASNASHNKVDFQDGFYRRATFINALSTQLCLDQLRPISTTIKQEGKDVRDAVVFTYPFVAMIKSMLGDPELMKAENLVVNQGVGSNPFAKYVSPDGRIGEINSGSWYSDTHDMMITNEEVEFLCPIVIYLDKTFIDVKGRYQMEPVVFTLSIFNQKLRNQSHAWRHLAYMAHAAYLTIAQKAMISSSSVEGQSMRNYQAQLAVALSSLIESQTGGGFQTHLTLIGLTRLVTVKTPVVFFVGDNESQDKLTIRIQNRGDNTDEEVASRLCRMCDVTFANSGYPYTPCNPFPYIDFLRYLYDPQFIPAEIATEHNKRKLVIKHTKLMKQTYYVYLCDSPFNNLHFGYTRQGIYGATPLDMMHCSEEGLMRYLISVFFAEFTVADTAIIDRFISKVFTHMRQSGMQRFPRTTWTGRGISNCAGLTADETVGAIFTLSLVCAMNSGREMFRDVKMSNAKINGYQTAFEMALCYNAWAKQDSFWKLDLHKAEHEAAAKLSIQKFLGTLVEHCYRNVGAEWNLQKVHEHVHVPSYISLYGSPNNFHTGRCEAHLKEHAKKPARTAQKRHEVFTPQVCRNLHDELVLSRARRVYGIPDVDKKGRPVREHQSNPEKMNCHDLLGRFRLIPILDDDMC